MKEQGPNADKSLSQTVGLKFQEKKPALVLRSKTQEQESEDALKEKQASELLYSKQKDDFIKLQNLLNVVFDEREWECQVVGKHFTFKHKTQPKQIVEIEKFKNEIRLYGYPIEKIIEVAQRYERAFGAMNYEIVAGDLKTAVIFLQELHQHGFQINKVINFNLKSKEPFDLKGIIASIKAEMPDKKPQPVVKT
ncbi:MAG: hypothetical protein JSS07_11465 [Proteobacteria bacterium]|nr:hypothetical protein [Pseudomonadota bacterium]